MKNYRSNIRILICIVCIITFASCQDALDVSPDGRASLDKIFEDESTAGAYLNSCYTDFPKWYVNEWHWTNTRIALSDNAWDRDDREGLSTGRYYRGDATAANPILENESGNATSKWVAFWGNIRRCNVFLSNIEKTPMSSENTRARWIAEAKVIRAFFNFENIIRYGELPISTDPFPLDYNYAELKKESFRACVDNIIKDCEEALAEPHFPWRITSASEQTRMTKAVASMIKSRAILFAASDLWNDNQNYWAEAEKLTKETLDACLANGYELYRQLHDPQLFQSAYHEYTCIMYTDALFTNDPVDKESILFSRENGWDFVNNINGMPLFENYKAGLCPTQELIDAYDMKTTGQPVLKLDKPYLDTRHLNPNFNTESGYDEKNPYKDRDPRFYATVYFNGTQRLNRNGILTDVQTYPGGNCELRQDDRKHTLTGYYMRKYDHPSTISWTPGGVAYKAMRLAELYLNYAEAAIENGNLKDAETAVNVLRDRVDMPHITFINKEEARYRLRNERRVELAYEEHRYFDLRRWTKPDGDLEQQTRYLTGMIPVKTGVEGVFEYKRFSIGDGWDPVNNKFLGAERPRNCYQNKYLKWPIPLSECNRLESVTGVKWQNPGW